MKTNSKPVYIGVDIGGTSTKIGLVNESLTILATSSFHMEKIYKPAPYVEIQPFIERLAEEITQLVQSAGLSNNAYGIGIGSPGKVDSREGIIYNAANLGWDRVPMADEINARLHLPVVLEHDVSAHALGEAMAGAGVNHKNIICTTIGTGVAAGIIVDGHVVHGGDWSAGEIGHDAVDGEDTPCACGKKGCMETIVSGPGIARLAELQVRLGNLASMSALRGKITAEDVFEAAKNGDEVSIKIFEHVGNVLGRKLSTLVYALNPELIIIGGGVASAAEYIINPVRKTLWDQVPSQRLNLKVLPAKLGNQAGILGAAYSIMQAVLWYKASIDD